MDEEKQEEHPKITRLDEEAQIALETRRKFLLPHKHGWWRNMPSGIRSVTTSCDQNGSPSSSSQCFPSSMCHASAGSPRRRARISRTSAVR